MMNELKRRVDLPESSHATKLARSDDIDGRGWGLEPEHTIFLCHSGKQKNFTEWLWKELKQAHHFPFFDKCPESLPKGHEFPSAIIQAAQQCHVAILVLSEDFFTCSRWPMIELNEFVKAQASTNSNLKLLPLFYKISVEDLKDVERQKRWQDIWQGWAVEDLRRNGTHTLDVGAWASALSVMVKSNGLEYVEEVGEVTYVANVVDAVCKLKLPRVKYDVSHVQSLQRLCEVIFAKFHVYDDNDCDNKVQAIGLCGMGGVGKTTITKAMCNGLYGDFDGEYCHVEFGGREVGELRRQLLLDLIGDTSLPNDLNKLKTLLDKCMHQKKVFLCLDNVLLDKDIAEARMYLELPYKVGSKVLVTSRSLATLQSLRLQEWQCMEMPELDKSDAIKLFLHHAGLASTSDINDPKWDVINGCVQACLFLKRSLHDKKNDSSTTHYLPLALMVWGTQLGQVSKCPLDWKESLENLSTHKFNSFSEAAHPLFSLLRQGYDSLTKKVKLFFLDLAIFVIGATKYDFNHYPKLDVVKWLQHAHGHEIFFIMQSLRALKRKALLDFVMVDKESEFPSYYVHHEYLMLSKKEKVLQFRIHDLYLEFAKEEVQALESTNQDSGMLYDFGKKSLPPKLRRKWECHKLNRLGIYESEVKSIKRDDLSHCSQVKVLQVYGCKNLEELDVGGMYGMCILDVLGCGKLSETVQGLNELKDLKWLRLQIQNPQHFFGDFSSLTALQYLELCGYSIHCPNLSGCKNLLELILHANRLPNLGELSLLEKVKCHNHGMKSIIGLNTLTNLKVLELLECISLEDLPGLCNLGALETLNVNDTHVSELLGIGKLLHLQELSVSNCAFLTSLVELEFVTSLRRLEACSCESLQELPNMSNLTRLEVVYLDESAISKVPRGFGQLAKNRIFSFYGCVELLEPLVLWLWEQELILLEGQVDSTSQAFPDSEEIEDELWSSMRKDVAYYMDQASTRSYQWDALDALDKQAGGIDFVIKIVCDYEDMGILCLVVAKYAAMDIPDIVIPRLSSRIIDFLYQQLNSRYVSGIASGSREFYYSEAGHPTFWHIFFILDHVMDNDMLMESLEAHNICLFIEKSLQDNHFWNDVWHHGNDVNPILEQWASYLDRCCFCEDCLCSLLYSSYEE